MTTNLPRTALPETVEAAEEFDRRASAYRRAGLCDADAAYAAWRHAVGWLTRQRPPCEPCRRVVAQFPQSTADPAWRKHPRGRAGARSTRSAVVPGVSGCLPLPTGSTDGRQVAR